jgi:predicted phage-related endonuclease
VSLSKEQLALRKQGIGASEAAAALGQSDFGRGPLNVWAQKVLPLQGEALEAINPRVRFGNLLEPYLGPLYAEITGRKVRRVGQTALYEADPIILATLDFEAEDRPVEVKNTAADQAWRWGDGGEYQTWAKGVCPFDYFVQLQIQMLVKGKPVGDLAALIGGNDFRVYTFPFDEDLAVGIAAELHAWWFEFVVPERQPPADGCADAASILRRRFPLPLKPIEDCTSAMEMAALERLAAAKTWRKQAEEEEDQAAAEVMQILGEREGLRWDGGKVTWSLQAGRPRYAQLVESLGIGKDEIAKFTSEPARTLRFYPAKERR